MSKGSSPRPLLEAKNKAKLESAKLAGYNIKLILDKEEIDATTLD